MIESFQDRAWMRLGILVVFFLIKTFRLIDALLRSVGVADVTRM